MKPNTTPSDLGLPLRGGPVRFAVGPPDGLTSNAWRIWTTKYGDAYIACRDNFREVKVSLHASGRWRMGFTEEALVANPSLLQGGENRAWDVWDEPPPVAPGIVTAFRLVFLPSELAVSPEQRRPEDWKNVLYIEGAPYGKLTVLTVFVTDGEPTLSHESEPSFVLASLTMGGGRFLQVVAHFEPEGNLTELVADGVEAARAKAQSKGLDLPPTTYAYFLGNHPDGSRFIVGARVYPNGIETTS